MFLTHKTMLNFTTVTKCVTGYKHLYESSVYKLFIPVVILLLLCSHRIEFYPCSAVSMYVLPLLVRTCTSVHPKIRFCSLTLVCLNQIVWNLYAMLITTIHQSSLNFSCVTFTILAFYATLQIGKMLEILVSVL